MMVDTNTLSFQTLISFITTISKKIFGLNCITKRLWRGNYNRLIDRIYLHQVNKVFLKRFTIHLTKMKSIVPSALPLSSHTFSVCSPTRNIASLVCNSFAPTASTRLVSTMSQKIKSNLHKLRNKSKKKILIKALMDILTVGKNRLRSKLSCKRDRSKVC